MVKIRHIVTFENRVKVCYAFFASPEFYHQEITVLNPSPENVDLPYLFPKSLRRCERKEDSNTELPSIEEILETSRKRNAPVIVTGSHHTDEDVTITVIALPDVIDKRISMIPEQLLIIRISDSVDLQEQEKLKDKIFEMYEKL